jgi:hypothetical protein
MPPKNKDFPADNGARSELAPPDRFVQETYANARAKAESCLEDAAVYTRRNPEKALLSALGTGYALRLLPTTRILGGVVRLSLALIKPAAVVYGVAKLWHMSQGSLSVQSSENSAQGE